MRNRLMLTAASLVVALGFAPVLRGQATARSGSTAAQTQSASSAAPDLSGDWERDGRVPESVSPSDANGDHPGKETDIPYKPATLDKFLSERPPTGPNARFDDTTDPYINYCEPLGLLRIFGYPGAKSRFVQTPDAVYILHDLGPTFRMVRLNAKHLDDPDPQWWGDSIGWYENGDTLVVDTIGVNDKTWLDQIGHPHSDQLHLIERFKRVDKNTLVLDVTIDDPGAYTKPFTTRRTFKISTLPFMRYQWVCSTRENEQFHTNLGKPAIPSSPAK
jgi:hypothetical protein